MQNIWWKSLIFEPEDECNSALEAACGRISSLKTVKTHFESKTFLILLNEYQDDVFVQELSEEQSFPSLPLCRGHIPESLGQTKEWNCAKNCKSMQNS